MSGPKHTPTPARDAALRKAWAEHPELGNEERSAFICGFEAGWNAAQAYFDENLEPVTERRDDTADLASPACSNCGDDNGLYIGLAHTHLCRECITHAAKHLPTLDIPSPAKSLTRDVAAAFGIEETPEMVGSLSHFLRHITYEEALDAIAITMSKGIKGHDAFRYFCGICWNWIRPGRNA